MARKAELDAQARNGKAFTPKAIEEKEVAIASRPTAEEVRGMKKAELVGAAEGLGLDSSGKVDELRARILEALGNG